MKLPIFLLLALVALPFIIKPAARLKAWLDVFYPAWGAYATLAAVLGLIALAVWINLPSRRKWD